MSEILFMILFELSALLFCSYLLYDCKRDMKRLDKELAEIGIDTSKWK